MVKVKPTNNQGKISVKTSLEANTYSIKDNMSEYYAKLSERWANSSEIIEGVDYSAKYYANKAKESVDNIGTYKEDVEEIVNNFEADVQTAKTDIENARVLSIQNVSNTCASFSATLDDVITEKTQDLNVILDSKKEELETLNDEIINNCKDIIGRVGFNMFDTVIKDHVLTYEESKGLALQGTYVYKNAVTGSRYGYADFYNKVVEEYNEATLVQGIPFEQPILTANGTMGGDSFAVEASSVYSTTYPAYKAFDNDNATNWLAGATGTSSLPASITFYNPKSLNITNLEITNREGSATYATAGVVYGSNDNSTWEKISDFTNDIATSANAIWNIDLSGNTKFYKYHKIEVTSATFASTSHSFGFAGINITATYREIDVALYKNLNGHIFYDIAEKDKVDEVFASIGSAWFYGVDTENERVFLPRKNLLNLNPQSEIPIAGNGNSLGLMTAKTLGTPLSDDNSQTFSLILDNGSSHNYEMFKVGGYNIPLSTSASGSTVSKPDNAPIGVTTDSSASGLVADLSNCTVNNNEMLLYICVGNTESVSSVTDVVEVTTTENDTTPLFTGMYFDFKPNNVSWLKGGEQANSGGIYTFCYNELVNELTTPKYNLKVINEADMIVGVDYSEYWKVNQDNMTFTTPTAISNKALSGAVKGNGMTLGLTDGAQNTGLFQTDNANNLTNRLQAYGLDVGSSISQATYIASKTLGVTTDATKSGIIAEQSTAQLYFKVANTVQNLELLDAGKVLEAVANKADIDLNNTIASQNFINQSISWGMPDYSAGLQITLSATDFVAPCDGIVAGDGNRAGTDNETNIYVNGAFVGKTTNSSQAISINLSKGDALTVSAGNVTTYFYPLKGVN